MSVLECSDCMRQQCESLDGYTALALPSTGTRPSRLPVMEIYLILLCCLPLLGLMTGVVILARANHQRVAYAKA